jgi:hypothetical protein
VHRDRGRDRVRPRLHRVVQGLAAGRRLGPAVHLQQPARSAVGRAHPQAARQPAAARGLRLEDPHRPPRGPDHPLQRRLPAGATQTKPDTITRSVNLACIENLAKQGMGYDHTVDPAVCDGFYKAEDKNTWPLKAQPPARELQGQARADHHRAPTTARPMSAARPRPARPPQNGPDTCCDACDYELSVNVWKYGVTSGWTRRQGEPVRRRHLVRPRRQQVRPVPRLPHVVDRSQEVRSYDYPWPNEEETVPPAAAGQAARDPPRQPSRRPRAADRPVHAGRRLHLRGRRRPAGHGVRGPRRQRRRVQRRRRLHRPEVRRRVVRRLSRRRADDRRPGLLRRQALERAGHRRVLHQHGAVLRVRRDRDVRRRDRQQVASPGRELAVRLRRYQHQRQDRGARGLPPRQRQPQERTRRARAGL